MMVIGIFWRIRSSFLALATEDIVQAVVITLYV